MGNIQFEDSKILFDDAKIAFDPACCCDDVGEDCSGCLDGTVPLTMAVTFSGVGDLGGFECGDCSEWNKTHILDQIVPGLGNSCEYGLSGFNGCFSFPQPSGVIQLNITRLGVPDPDEYFIELDARPVVSGSEARYTLNLGTEQPDCSTLNVSLNLVAVVGSPQCTWPLTCTLVAG